MIGFAAKDRHEQPTNQDFSERTVYSFELGEKPGIHLSKMLAIYEALGLVLKVEVVDPPRLSGSEEPSSERVIADFLAQVKGDLYGTD